MDTHRNASAEDAPAGRGFVRWLLGRRRRGPATLQLEPGEALSSRLAGLEAQLDYVEALLEGLQDAVHRRSQLDDRRNEELLRRFPPERPARDIGNDPRAREP